MMKNIYCFSCKVLGIRVRFWWNLKFLWQIFEKKNTKYQFMEIRPLGDELFHVDRRMDGHDEADSRFS